MKPRQWMTTLGLLALVVFAAIGLVMTRSWRQPEQEVTRGRLPRLVDEQPLITARSIAALAIDRNELRFAQQAVKLADTEVDLAFAEGMREAAQVPVSPTPEIRGLMARKGAAEAALKPDQALVEQLKKQTEASSGTRHDELQKQLNVALVQVELDQDELDDVNSRLLRSSTDDLSRIQRQFNRHETDEHALEAAAAQANVNNQANNQANNPELNYLSHNLWTQVTAWRSLRDKRAILQLAIQQANENVAKLSQKHNEIEKRVQSEKPVNEQNISPTSALTKSKSQKAVISASVESAAISSLQHLSVEQKNLADLNKRIQEHQEIANVYTSWTDHVDSKERATFRGMIESGLLIVLIFLAVYLAEQLVRHFFADLKEDHTRMRTLRTVSRYSVMAFGAMMLLFVVFGLPSQVPALVGLAGLGAGLTVALKDFFTAFFGGLVLMGSNGIRVGDWVEINGVVGEVVEINPLRTILLETGNWADTSHPTGRKVAFMNNFATVGHYFNYSSKGQWLWDELEVLVPQGQDPYPLIGGIQKLVTDETTTNAKAAEEEWKLAKRSRPTQIVSGTPAIDLRPTVMGVAIHVRYITQVHERYTTRSRLYQMIIELMMQKKSDSKSNV